MSKTSSSLMIVAILALGWFAGSTYWYVCETQELCEDTTPVTSNAATEPKIELTIAEEPAPTFDKTTEVTVYFNPNEATFASFEWQPELNKVIDYAKESNEQLIVTGYTADVTSDTDENTLSLDRASSIADYMIEAGVNSNFISIEVKAGSDPAADNSTEEGRALNRRAIVEFAQK